MVAPAPHRSFRLGRLVATPGALEAFQRNRQMPLTFLLRHARGGWGELCEEDRKANDAAVAHEGDPERQGRVLSAYRLADNTRIWIITEWNRSVTTILLPEEY